MVKQAFIGLRGSGRQQKKGVREGALFLRSHMISSFFEKLLVKTEKGAYIIHKRGGKWLEVVDKVDKVVDKWAGL